jgi:hypothetical protein
MNICRFAVLASLGLLIALTAVPLSAQRTFDVKEGELVRVRMWGSEDQVIEGSLQGIEENDLLILSNEGKEVSRIPMSQIREVWVRRGSRNQALEGLEIGLVSGAIVGLVVGLASGDDESGLIRFSAGEKAGMGAVGFGMISGAAGLLIGAISRTDRWERVSLPAVNPSVQVAPNGRLAVGISIPTRR